MKQGLKIFIVEDDPATIDNLKYRLNALDMLVIGSASDGITALKSIEEAHPDLVLIDINLEGKTDGIETARKIQERFSLPVVYLTASSDDETIARAKITEPYGYILKPCGDNELKIAIEMARYRHKMAIKLQESEARVSTILNSLPDLIIQTSPKGALLKFYGHSDSEDYQFEPFIGKNISELMPEKITRTLLSKIQSVLDTHRPDTYNFWLPVQGKKKYWEIRIIDSGDQNVLLIVRDMTSRKLSQEKIDRTSSQLRALATKLQIVREEERTRIARDLHDELGHILTVVKIDLMTILKQASAASKTKVIDPLKHTVELVNDSIASIKRIITDLRPAILDHLGLADALEWQIEQFTRRTQINCQAQIQPGSTGLSKDVETSLFRIFQETLTNISRHAQATNIKVKFARTQSGFVLSVNDDGIGLEESKLEESYSLGLLGIKERAKIAGGRLIISGAPQKGTTISVVVPAKSPTPA